MHEPLKVTFDKNVYEFIVDPEKDAPVSSEERDVFRAINKLINDRKILPFISETIITYEAVAKKERFNILTYDSPIVVKAEGSLISLSSNPEIYPGNHLKDDVYLTKAIGAGFKILPGKRFGKLINPGIKNEWYYFIDEDYFTTAKRFEDVVKEIEIMGAGYSHFLTLITTKENKHLPRNEKLKFYKGSVKKLSAAVAEWSDGDSIALHIAYGVDYFCTYDEGKNAGRNSTFGQMVYGQLNRKFGVKKVMPRELLAYANFVEDVFPKNP